ncbi:MAG: PaaI family thioesterase [Myxococcaceae bacterium]|nr:PaaI family thioesterase [Myxococcaceae bacterium]
MQLHMTPTELEQTIAQGFGQTEALFRIELLEPGRLHMRTPFEVSMLRPGNVVSGPALFTAADLAMYALVLAHIGPQLMAVTAQLNINFLSRGTPGDIRSEAVLLKLGRKLAVMEVRLFSGPDPALVAHVTGSYSLPRTTA